MEKTRRFHQLNRRWKAIFLVLLIVTIAVVGIYVKVYATVKKSESFAYICYIVWELDREPEKYWNLTEPDPYILEAIEHPGEWTEPFFFAESTFWYTAIWDDPDLWGEPHPIQPVPFKYNGTYYDYMFGKCDTFLCVTPLDEEPEEYWNLTNPDKYLLEAIKNPGETIAVGINSTTLGILWKHEGIYTFLYNGSYYEYDVTFIDWDFTSLPNTPNPAEKLFAGLATGLATAWVITGLIYMVANRKTKKS